MAITKATKLAIALLSTGGIGGVAYGVHEFSKETIGDKLKGTLLTKGQKDNAKWESRVDSLKKAVITELSESLKKIKSDNTKVSDLQAWCDTNLKNKFSSKEDKLFTEIQKYCGYNNKDMLTGVVEISAWNNEKNNKKLKDNTNGLTLSKAMKEIKDKLTVEAGKDANALREWCEKTYQKPFKDEKNQDFLDAKEYCVTTE